jgi:hypothetical protein
MATKPIILQSIRKLDQAARAALELLTCIMLPMDTAERSRFWEGISADIVAKGLQRGLSMQEAQEGAEDWARFVIPQVVELEIAARVAGSA